MSTLPDRSTGHAIQIEAFGDNENDLSGSLYVTDNIPVTGQTTGSILNAYTLKQHLIEPSDGKSVTQNPYSSKVKASSYTFNLRMHDDIATTFFNTEERSFVKLDGDISIDEETSFTVNSTDFTAPGVLWIDNEAIYIDGSSGGDTYSIGQRAVYGSIKREHGDGTLVFNEFPNFENKKVRLYSYDLTKDIDSRELIQRWTGVIKNSDVVNISTNQNGTILQIPSSDPLSKRDDWVVNKDRNQLTLKEDLDFVAVNNPDRAGVSGLPGGLGQFQKLHKDTSYDTERAVSFWKVDPDKDQKLEESILYKRDEDNNTDTATVLDSPLKISEDGSNEISGRMSECFVIDEAMDNPSAGSQTPLEWSSSTWPLTQANLDAQAAGISSPINDAFLNILPYHPIAIDAAMIFSTSRQDRRADLFNIYNPPWALDLRWLMAGEQGSDAISKAWDLIKKTSGIQIQQLLLGWEPDPIQWLKWSEKHLLEPVGFKRVLTQEGELSWSRRDVSSIVDFSEAQGRPSVEAISKSDNQAGILKWNPVAEKRISTVIGEYDVKPWDDITDLVSATSTKGDIGRSSISLDEDATLQLGSWRKQQAKKWVENRLSLQSFADPIIRIEVQDYNEINNRVTSNLDLNYDLGEKLIVDNIPVDRAWLVDTDGNRVKNIQAEPQWIGQIIGRYYNPRTLTYELDLFLANYLDNTAPRLRAPSMIVHDIGEAGGELPDDEYLYGPEEEVITPKYSDYGDFDRDLNHFHIGDEVEIWSQNGATKRILTNGPYIVVSLTNAKTAPDGLTRNAMELENQDGNNPDLTDIEDGDVIRLAEFSDYDSDFLDNVSRAFVYLCSDNSKLSEGGSDEEDPDRFA